MNNAIPVRTITSKRTCVAFRCQDGGYQTARVSHVRVRLFFDSLWCLYVEAHKNLWADHGDFISAQYSGTHALKRDITRTGTRTLGGLLQDGSTALSRYYKSKFSDGSSQDCLNLWASHFLASVDKPSPFAKSGCVFFFFGNPLAIATSSLKRLSTGRKRAKRPVVFSAHLTRACYMSLPCSPFNMLLSSNLRSQERLLLEPTVARGRGGAHSFFFSARRRGVLTRKQLLGPTSYSSEIT